MVYWKRKCYNRYIFFTYRYDVIFKIYNWVNDYVYSSGAKTFRLQDHLGNNRVVTKSDGTVIQTTYLNIMEEQEIVLI